MGFEPTRAEHIGLAVQRLNHSATSSIGNLYGQGERYLDKNGKLEGLSQWGIRCVKEFSHAGNWTRASWVKARYPSH